MNSRPLTYINSDEEEIVTPGHLLIGKRIINENTQHLQTVFQLEKYKIN